MLLLLIKFSISLLNHGVSDHQNLLFRKGSNFIVRYENSGSIGNGHCIFPKESSFLAEFATGFLNYVSIWYLYFINGGGGSEGGDYTFVGLY